MKQATNSSFNEGLLMDLNPLVTPQTCLSDCLNGTIITYNGNEYTLLTDMGNAKIERAILPEGFIPIGSKEYGGILYLVLYNPEGNMCEIGSIPSPDYDVTPTGVDLEMGSNQNGILLSSENSIILSPEGGYEFKETFLKLFEPELLMINPGDLYAFGYAITSENGSVDLFESDPQKKPLYSVSFYAIDEDNKQYKLNDLDIVKLNDLYKNPENYSYFNHTVKSVLALSVNINHIDWFEAVAYEKDISSEGSTEKQKAINLSFYGKNKLNQDENDADDLIIKGCKIDYDISGSNEKTIYVQNGEISPSFKHTYLLKDDSFKLDDEVNINITPYDLYRYLDELKRNLNIKIGQVYSPGKAGSLFKYKYSYENKSLRLDFNLQSLGMINPYMYLEFYDIWSDYSVIIPVEDINPAGLNTLFIDTISEPVKEEYTIASVGGTPRLVIDEYNLEKQSFTGKIYKPFLSNYKYRKNPVLRENNLYLVKLSVIDIDGKDVEKLTLSDYTNVYKYLIVNENYNELYDLISESGVTEGVDFNTENLNNPNVKLIFDYKLNNKSFEEVEETKGEFSTFTEVAGNKYYYTIKSPTEQTDSAIQSLTTSYSVTSINEVDLEIKSFTGCFGKLNIFDYELSSNSSNLDITETNESITTSSSEVSYSNKTISLGLKTDRSILAYVQNDEKNLPTITKKVFLADKLFKNNNGGINSYSLWMEGGQAENGADHPTYIINANDKYLKEFDKYGVKSNTIDKLFQNLNLSGYSGAILSLYGRYDDDDFTLQKYKKGPVFQSLNSWVPLLRTKTSFVVVNYINKEKCIEIMEDLYFPIIQNKENRYSYYLNVKYDDYSITSLTGTITPKLNAFIEFEQYSKSITEGGNEEYKKFTKTNDLMDNIFNLMESRGISDYTIPENFAYFELGTIDTSTEIDLKIPSLEIKKGASEKLVNGLINGKEDMYKLNPHLTSPPSYSTQVRSNSGNYVGIASKFEADLSGSEDVSFRYIPQDLFTDTTWREDSWAYRKGIDLDWKNFDQF